MGGMRWAGHVAGIWKWEFNDAVISKPDESRTFCRKWVWIGGKCSSVGLIENCVMAGCCEGGYEPLGAVKGRKCVDYSSDTSGCPLSAVSVMFCFSPDIHASWLAAWFSSPYTGKSEFSIFLKKTHFRSFDRV